MQVWLNGQFVERNDARLSVFDAGLQHAVGLFETMGASNGRIFRGPAHMQRLLNSARELRLCEQLNIEPLLEAAEHTVLQNEMDIARVRLTLTGGDLNAMMRASPEQRADPTILIVAQPPTEYPPQFFEAGITAVVADARDNPFSQMAGHKTLWYWPRIQALQLAASRRAGEALWFSVSNHLAGGSVSNAFLVRDGALLTPIAHGEEEEKALRSVTLPGITRAVICELAETAGLDVVKRMLDIEDVLAADEVFLTNSSWGVLPVTAVEREKIGSGEVGEVTKTLRTGWLDAVESETALG